MHTTSRFSFIFALLFFIHNTALGQTQLVQDFSKTLEIPDVSAVEASSSHLYALSETDGMAVFRVYGDSLQWLYTSAGMQRRGHTIESDIRFAYLYGDSRRLTVLEPTSVLGVYSSTLLPSSPLGVARLDNELYVALGQSGLGRLMLDTPETVDTEPEIIENGTLGRTSILDVVSSVISNQLFVLTGNSKIFVYTKEDEGLTLASEVDLSSPLTHLFIDNEQIWGATSSGNIYEINANGLGRLLGSVDETPSDIISWNDHIFVKTNSGQIWLSKNGGTLRTWKDDRQAGNFITKSSTSVWVSSYNKLSPLKTASEIEFQSTTQTEAQALALKPIPNITLTYPKPLLLAIELEGGIPGDDVEFVYRSTVNNAELKKQGFYWQPTVNQIGFSWFTIIATNAKGDIDSTRFSVDVRTFNAPPRFSPVRNSSIVVNDPYELKFNATDPENPNSPLIRYLGVDLPDGATVDERTGLFQWTPTERQVGDNSFRIIATDEQGAAASQEVTLTVLDISREGN